MDDVDRRRPDRDGDGSRELGLLCGPAEPEGDSDRGEVGAIGSRLLVLEAGDRALGCV